MKTEEVIWSRRANREKELGSIITVFLAVVGVAAPPFRAVVGVFTNKGRNKVIIPLQ